MAPNHPLFHLFSSNNPPNEAESSYTQRKVDELEKRVFELQRQLRLSETQLKKHRNVLSAVRRIPVEVLSEIFAYATPPILDSPGRLYLLNLCLVCKRWRDAALATHRLWAGLHLRAQEMELDRGLLQEYQNWYARAGSVRKTLEFDASVPIFQEGADEDDLSALIQTKVILGRLLTEPETPHLDHFTLRCTNLACFLSWARVLKACTAKLPNKEAVRPWDALNSLSLLFCPGREDFIPANAFLAFFDDDLPLMTEFANALPRILKSFHIEFPPVATALPRIPETWPLLTSSSHFKLRQELLDSLESFSIKCDWPGTHILMMLNRCPNAKTIAIDLAGQVLDLTPELMVYLPAKISMPHAHTYKLQDIPSVKFMELFDLPSLQHVEFGTSDPESGLAIDEDLLRHMFATSPWARRLTSLRLYNAEISSNALADILMQLPALRQLTIEAIRIDSVLWTLLRAKVERGDKCLPQLERLNLLQARVPMDSMAEFFMARPKTDHDCVLVLSSRANPRSAYDLFTDWKLKESGVVLCYM